MHWEGFDLLLALNCDHSWLCALGDDRGALALLVLLGQVREVLSNRCNVGGVLEVVGLGVGSGLGFVADNVVPVRRSLVERVLEELADEGRVE